MSFIDFFKYTPEEKYEFTLPKNANNIPDENEPVKPIDKVLIKNLEYIKTKYNTIINSDVVLKKFTLSVNNTSFLACLLFIDGMVDEESINNFILQPIFLKNSILMRQTSKRMPSAQKQNFNLESFISDSLIPQCSLKEVKDFDKVFSLVNGGFSALFIDTLDLAFCIEAKDIKGRSISEPQTESIIKGSHESFVENLRTNTSLIRKIVNNENLTIEEFQVGEFSHTKVSLCYINNITNDDLVAEVKYRISNLDIDFLSSSGELEQLIQDSKFSPFPQLISTERPDRASTALFEGKVVIIVNGSPYVLIAPAIFIDFLTSPEDQNSNVNFANFLRFIRVVALIFALFLPGLYVAITNYHQELIPTELLFAIESSREAIPFPVIFEILIMEISFELIREAGLRTSSSFSTTVGIIGALILGDAAVSANIVSPILIIIVAFAGICSFAIPDYSLGFSLRLFRFMYIVLGYLCGFLGIAFRIFHSFFNFE